MSLSRLKALAHISATRKFTDRENAKEAFARALDVCFTSGRFLKVLNYYGVGGIGKTSLLNHLSASVEDRKDLRCAFVDLDSAILSGMHDVLLEIRYQLRLPCPLFEYALARLFATSGRSLGQLRSRMLADGSLLFDLADAAASVAEVIAPARLIKKLYEIADNNRRRYLSSLKDEFDKIDAIPDAELLKYLPYYLGIEIAKISGVKELGIIIFFDSSEALTIHGKFQHEALGGEEALQELIGSAETGLYVLAGRNYMKWIDCNHEWANHLEQHFLGQLADSDAEYFLSEIPIPEPEIRAAIVESSRGVPLYLDLCASTYLIRREDGERLLPLDFHAHGNDVIRRFLTYLDPSHQHALEAVSILDLFDRALFSEVTRALNIPFPLMMYKEFCENSSAVAVDADRGLFRIHDIVRAYIREHIGLDVVASIRDAIILQLSSDESQADENRRTWIFDQVFAIASCYPLDWTTRQVHFILEAGLVLIDRGRWSALQASISRIGASLDLPTAPAATGGFHTVTLLLRAYCKRKCGALREAQIDYERVTAAMVHLGPWQSLAKYLRAHTEHLLGNYGQASEVYKNIVVHHGAELHTDPAWWLASRQLADIWMMEGKFVDALAAFTRLQANPSNDPIWQAETFRFRGHVYRFNFLFDEAELMYRQTLEIAQRVQAFAMAAKAQTNLVETLCWTNPQLALRHADVAIELNRDVIAPIEIGKAHAAQALAFARSGAYEQATEAANTALTIHRNCGYRAGQLFSLQASGVISYLTNNPAEANNVLRHMDELIDELRVYHYLKFVVHSLLSVGNEVAWLDQCQWLDFSLTQAALKTSFHRKFYLCQSALPCRPP